MRQSVHWLVGPSAITEGACASVRVRVGQRNLSTTADTYTHAMIAGYREIDREKLLERVQNVLFAATF